LNSCLKERNELDLIDKKELLKRMKGNLELTAEEEKLDEVTLEKEIKKCEILEKEKKKTKDLLSFIFMAVFTSTATPYSNLYRN
jgi:hypothetical protein